MSIEKNKKKIAINGLVLVSILALIVGLFLLFGEKGDNQAKVNAPQPTNTITSSKTNPVTTEDLLANKKNEFWVVSYYKINGKSQVMPNSFMLMGKTAKVQELIFPFSPNGFYISNTKINKDTIKGIKEFDSVIKVASDGQKEKYRDFQTSAPGTRDQYGYEVDKKNVDNFEKFFGDFIKNEVKISFTGNQMKMVSKDGKKEVGFILGERELTNYVPHDHNGDGVPDHKF